MDITEDNITDLGFEYFADAQYSIYTEQFEFNWDKETGMFLFIIDSLDSVSLEHIKTIEQLKDLYFILTNKKLSTRCKK
jgi:hypothetical protein